MHHAGISDESDIASRFSEALGGVMLNYYNHLGEAVYDTWSLVKAQFDRRFDPASLGHRVWVEFKALGPLEGEPAEAYKQQFLTAWEMVYPNLQVGTSAESEWMVDVFLETIPDEALQVAFCDRRPKLVKDCCSAMHDYMQSRARVVTTGYQQQKLGKAPQKPMASETEELWLKLAELKLQFAEAHCNIKSSQEASRNGAVGRAEVADVVVIRVGTGDTVTW